MHARTQTDKTNFKATERVQPVVACPEKEFCTHVRHHLFLSGKRVVEAWAVG
jgi:hypothetical protein